MIYNKLTYYTPPSPSRQSEQGSHAPTNFNFNFNFNFKFNFKLVAKNYDFPGLHFPEKRKQCLSVTPSPIKNNNKDDKIRFKSQCNDILY